MHLQIENHLAEAFNTGASHTHPDYVGSGRIRAWEKDFRDGLQAEDNFIDAVEDIRGLMTVAHEMGQDCENVADAQRMGREMAVLVKETAITLEEWRVRYARLSSLDKAINQRRNDRARKLCAEAGLDPNLLGIHPHNADVNRHYGQPWPNIDYDKVDACLAELKHEFTYIAREYDRRVRVFPFHIQPYTDEEICKYNVD